jgi:RNA polymerase sigma-70 factor (ECF subfamily)
MELSEKELTQFINKFQDKVFRTCLGFVQNTADANDLTQDVFLSVIESIDSFRNEAQLSTWVYRIAVNKSLNHLKKRKVRNIFQSLDKLLFKPGSGESHHYVHNPADEQETSQEAARLLNNALGKLSESQRVAFTLSKYDELNSSEIASIMAISVSAVDAHIHRAKRNILKELQHTEVGQIYKK